MPFYDYICSNCGHEFDALQKIADAPLTDCPQCNKSCLSKKVTAPVFRLKGGGWYETDFKTGDKKNIIHDDKSSSDTKAENKTSESKSSASEISKSKDSAKPTTSDSTKATTA